MRRHLTKCVDGIRSFAPALFGFLSRRAASGAGRPDRPRRRGATRTIALALQGGGSHGAFTWGVLDRLLEEERLQVEAISGASAGAMNGAVLASGYLDDGRDGARQALARLWRRVSEVGRLASLGNNPLAHLVGGQLGPWSPGIGFQFLTRVASPYQLNPLDLNPLRNLVTELVDFDRLRKNRKISLYVSATNVHSGCPRLFQNHELSSEVLLASACLPSLHRAVEIDGAYYWDGGFTANPAIIPLIRDGRSNDVVIVHIDTQGYPGLPVTAGEISDRLQRILMNAPLLREIEMIGDMKALAGTGSEFARRLDRLALHHLLPPDPMMELDATSKVNTDWAFLTGLRDLGRETAGSWLEDNFDRIGTGSAATLEACLFSPPSAAEPALPRLSLAGR